VFLIGKTNSKSYYCIDQSVFLLFCKAELSKMEKNDLLWALEQVNFYAQKLSESKEEIQRLVLIVSELKDSLQQCQNEIRQLAKLTATQQLYIEKLEELLDDPSRIKHKETTILTIHGESIKEDAC
jgi:hypothetical protein